MNDGVRLYISIGLLSLAGGSARLLYSYQPSMGWAASARIVFNSFYVGIVVGLIVWEPLSTHPTALMATIGATSWLGIDIARAMFSLIVKRILGLQSNGGPVNGS